MDCLSEHHLDNSILRHHTPRTCMWCTVSEHDFASMACTDQTRAVRPHTTYSRQYLCRQLETHRRRWNLQKLMCEVRKSWMKSKWTDLQASAASQLMQEIRDAQERCFADDQPEVGGFLRTGWNDCCCCHAHMLNFMTPGHTLGAPNEYIGLELMMLYMCWHVNSLKVGATCCVPPGCCPADEVT